MTSNAWRDTTTPKISGSSTHDVRGVSAASAAFRGASQAFSKAPTSGRSPQLDHHGKNAALTAASAAGLGKRREEKIPREAYSGTAQPGGQSIQRSGTNIALDTQDLARRNVQSRQQSPSQAAALFAATAKASATRKSYPPPSSIRSSPQTSPLHSVEDVRDVDPEIGSAIADINSLVNLFESKEKHPSPTPIVHSVRYVTKATPVVAKSRPTTPATRSFSYVIPSQQPPTSANIRLRGNQFKPAEGSHAVSLRDIPELPALHNTDTPTSLDGPDDTEGSSIAATRRSHGPMHPILDTTESFLSEAASKLRSRPAKSPVRPALSTRRTEPAIMPLVRSPAAMQHPSLLPQKDSKESLDPVRPSRRPGRASDSYVPQLSVDALANAMVASSLASSRAPSPSKPPALPPPRRHGKHSLLPKHGGQDPSRTPSPAKRMRQTMREPLKSDDEEVTRKHRNHVVRKHPNKYKEGDRKRYRNQVTEQERKRYEGVWAANRGILLDADSSDAVSNIVVRDIWKRSRLPDDVLEEVWSLVESRGSAKLDKAEFVIGMFLIDQRLKGNKLPFKVSDSIWSSVRHLSGINVSRDRR